MITLIIIKQRGNFNNTERFLTKSTIAKYLDILNKYGRKGVDVLSAATPVNTGETATSWGYEIIRTKRGIRISWTNSNVVDGVAVAILIQYGHGTGNGGYVQGNDFINPALKPIFDDISESIWKEITSL